MATPGELIEKVATAVGAGGGAWAVSFFGSIRDALKRLDRVEAEFRDDGRVARIERRLTGLLSEVGAYLEGREAKLVSGVTQTVTALVNERVPTVISTTLQRSSHIEVAAAREAGRVAGETAAKRMLGSFLASQQKDFERIEKELTRVRNLVEESTSSNEERYAAHVATEAERWNDVHRALGQIEGMLEAARKQRRDR